VVLIELAPGEPARTAGGPDPPAPGIGELVAGTASFGQIITRDRSSGIHVVGTGQGAPNLETVLRSANFVVALEALARSYDHVVIDVGAPSDAAAERLAQLAPRAVLIGDALDDRLTAIAQARLFNNGFAVVDVLSSAPAAPQSDATGTRAAA
jgi:MinD-like ATPase involved in chromosome partitioning or flagellar assembly